MELRLHRSLEVTVSTLDAQDDLGGVYVEVGSSCPPRIEDIVDLIAHVVDHT